jgi:hypothetical protein
MARFFTSCVHQPELTLGDAFGCQFMSNLCYLWMAY